MVKLLSTLFGIGYTHFIPGSIGSLAGVVIYYLCLRNVAGGWHLSNVLIYLGALLVLLTLGIWVSACAEFIFGEKDSRYIVIDELTGYLIAMFGLPPELLYAILAFILFRILDILKPPPISHLQGISGGLGIMLDDVAAGIMTCIILNTAVLIKDL